MMKTSTRTLLTVLLIAALVNFTSCSAKASAAQTGDAGAANTGEADGAAMPALSQNESDNIASLGKLGFHIFPQPVELPAFTLTALEGADLKSADLAGTITVLNFWATWCPPCKQEMPSIQRLKDLMKGSAFRIVAVSTGEAKKTVRDFIAKNKYTYPVYLDEKGSLGSSYASQGIPTTYILDKTGRIVAGVVGGREYDDAALVLILKAMAAQ